MNALSPFEFKNKLIEIANLSAIHNGRTMLNAGRGNPNWVATVPRQAFSQLNLFAIEESKRIMDLPNLGGIPEKNGSAKRLEIYLSKHTNDPGVGFCVPSLAMLTLTYISIQMIS